MPEPMPKERFDQAFAELRAVIAELPKDRQLRALRAMDALLDVFLALLPAESA